MRQVVSGILILAASSSALALDVDALKVRREEDDKSSVTVRVSLGLKARFERTLFWSPHKMVGGARLLTPRDGKWATKRDFTSDAEKVLVRPKPPRHGRQRLFVNPATGLLYVGEHTTPTAVACKSFYEVVRIVSVRLGYAAEARVGLKDVAD